MGSAATVYDVDVCQRTRDHVDECDVLPFFRWHFGPDWGMLIAEGPVTRPLWIDHDPVVHEASSGTRSRS
jgi:hypothetical protein